MTLNGLGVAAGALVLSIVMGGDAILPATLAAGLAGVFGGRLDWDRRLSKYEQT